MAGVFHSPLAGQLEPCSVSKERKTCYKSQFLLFSGTVHTLSRLSAGYTQHRTDFHTQAKDACNTVSIPMHLSCSCPAGAWDCDDIADRYNVAFTSFTNKKNVMTGSVASDVSY